MKRTTFCFFLLLFTLSGFAQQTHLKFMGFELNGSISDFHSKLINKGLTLSPQNNQYPTGMRCYNGVFSGHEAQILVWYNSRSKQVYRAKAIIKRYGKDLIEQLQQSMVDKMDTKYGTEFKYSSKVKDDYQQEFTQYSYLTKEGNIDLFIVSTGYSSQNDFYLHLDYNDKINSSINKNDEMDDL